MKKLLRKYKTIFTVIGGMVLVAVGYFFGWQNQEKIFIKSNEVDSGVGECRDYPDIPNQATKLVTKIVDGDTFIIEGGYSVRVLGLDADERGHRCYEAAKERLEELVLNKKVVLEKAADDQDQWCRYPRYVFLNGKNVGLQLVTEGLAVARSSVEAHKYREEFVRAESQAREKDIGCKWEE